MDLNEQVTSRVRLCVLSCSVPKPGRKYKTVNWTLLTSCLLPPVNTCLSHMSRLNGLKILWIYLNWWQLIINIIVQNFKPPYLLL